MNGMLASLVSTLQGMGVGRLPFGLEQYFLGAREPDSSYLSELVPSITATLIGLLNHEQSYTSLMFGHDHQISNTIKVFILAIFQEVLTTMRAVFSDWSKYLETDIDKFVTLQENGGLGEETERAIDLAAQSDQHVSVGLSEYTLDQMSDTNSMYDDHGDFAGNEDDKYMNAMGDADDLAKPMHD